MTRVAVLASGSGSNLQALMNACTGDFPARVVVVGSDRPSCGALQRAAAMGVPSVALRARDFADREAFDAAMADRIGAYDAAWVCLAGYMRLVSEAFLRRFDGRVLNIHPSLLPSFPGKHAVAQALASNASETGCTVHLVDRGMDTGPILGSARVPVAPGDNLESLSERILSEEHRLYPAMLRAAVEGQFDRHRMAVVIDSLS